MEARQVLQKRLEMLPITKMPAPVYSYLPSGWGKGLAEGDGAIVARGNREQVVNAMENHAGGLAWIERPGAVFKIETVEDNTQAWWMSFTMLDNVTKANPQSERIHIHLLCFEVVRLDVDKYLCMERRIKTHYD